MVLRDLRDLIVLLEQKGELRRVRVPVSSELEIAAVADRVVKAGGPALLFEQVDDRDVPVLINAFGSERRMCLALGVPYLDALGDRVRELVHFVQGPPPSSLRDKVKALGDLAHIASFAPKLVAKAPCQEVVRYDDATLDAFPILKCWPADGGRFITLPLVFTTHPATGRRNVGMYRMQVYDGRTTGMHWHLHKDGAAHYREAEGSGRRLPVAVALGADPATVYAATAPLPSAVDELVFAGFLRGEGVELVKCRTVDLAVPAHAEIVLEGYVDPAERRLEGPFGDHTGYYSLADMYPVFHITCISCRTKPIYPATIVGRPPMEDYFLGKATERLFLPVLQLLLPEIVDIHMPAAGCFHNLLLVSIRKEYPGQARKVITALWGMGQMMLTKTIIVVDHDVDVHDPAEVVWRVSSNLDPRRDLVLSDGPLDALDHAAPHAHFGSKLGIDATRKGPADGHPRDWPPDVVMDTAIKELVDAKWSQYGL